MLMKAMITPATAADRLTGDSMESDTTHHLGIAMFARTPGSGGKSRLASTWGRERTDIFYEHCLRCGTEWLQADQEAAKPYWAVTGATPEIQNPWGSIKTIEQCAGSLGARMAQISSELMQNHQYWCLVGTDIPQMPPLTTLQISARLQNADIVFGPSADGGFWLIAGSCLIPEEVWTKVRYSQADTMDQFISILSKEVVGVTIDTSLQLQYDVDLEKDLLPLRRELKANRHCCSPAQQQLLQWLESHEAGLR